MDPRLAHPVAGAPGNLPSPAAEVCLGFLYLIAALAAIGLTRAAGGAALIWPANAITAAVLIRFARLRLRACLTLIGIAAVAANVSLAADPIGVALSFAAINVGEVGLIVWVYRALMHYPVPAPSVNQATRMALMFGLAIPSLAALFGGALVHTALHGPLLESIFRWWQADALGVCIFGPPVMLCSREALRRLSAPRYLIQNCAIAITTLAFCFVAIRYIQFPFVVIGVPLLVAAFSLGGFGTAVMSLLCGLEVIGLWLWGIRPLGVEPGVYAAALRHLPLWALISALMPPIAVGIGSDVRRQSVRALRKSERRFRETLARSPIGAAIVDFNGIWLETNAAAQAMLGYTAEEFRALPAAALTHPEDRADILSRREALRAGDIDTYEAERRFAHKNGQWIWTRSVVSVVKGEDGEPPHFIVQMENLELRRAAERALMNERELLKTALRAIGNAVITTDSERRITYINAAARDILGQAFPDIEMRRFDEVVGLSNPNTSVAAPDLLGQSLALGRVVRRPSAYVLHRPDATASYVIMSVSPLFGSEDKVTGAVIVLQDATERYQWEEELLRQARYDALTGLMNRAEFARRTRRAFERARLLGEPAALIAIDLDRFKAVNDGGGHAAGDAVLCSVATTLSDIVRQQDAVARLGGDEFAVILEHSPAERTLAVASELLAVLNPLKTEWEGVTYEIGASLGVAIVRQEMADEAAWLSAADEACYAAKRAGRGVMRRAGATPEPAVSGSDE